MPQEQRRADDERITKLVTDVEVLQAEMSKNTEVTTQVRDILTGFRLMAVLAKWVAAVIAGLVAIKTGLTAFGK